MNQLQNLPVPKVVEPLAWLIGKWTTKTCAKGQFPTIKPFSYDEEIEFSCIGQPMLNYTAQSWHPESKKPMHREVGFLKIKPDSNQLSFFLSHNFGLTTIEKGFVSNQEINLVSTHVSRNDEFSKPPAVIKIKREFKIVDDTLHQTVYMATETTPELTEHLRATYIKSN